jgi:hypothetical protein
MHSWRVRSVDRSAGHKPACGGTFEERRCKALKFRYFPALAPPLRPPVELLREGNHEVIPRFPKGGIVGRRGSILHRLSELQESPWATGARESSSAGSG